MGACSKAHPLERNSTNQGQELFICCGIIQQWNTLTTLGTCEGTQSHTHNTDTDTHRRRHRHTHTHSHAHIDTRTHADTHAQTHTHAHARTQTRTHTHIHIRTHIYTHAHTHTYTPTHKQRCTHTHYPSAPVGPRVSDWLRFLSVFSYMATHQRLVRLTDSSPGSPWPRPWEH